MYAHKDETTKILGEFGIRDYEFPPMPADYRKSPDADAIERASAIRRRVVLILLNSLGDNKLAFIERLTALGTKAQGTTELVNIRVGKDGLTGTADLLTVNSDVKLPPIPVRFRKIDGQWYWDGKDELLFFDRQR